MGLMHTLAHAAAILIAGDDKKARSKADVGKMHMTTTSGPATDCSPSLLVVDDDPLQGESLQLVLQEHGFRVERCDSPHTALDLLAQGRIDLLLTDLRMPGMDGIELTRRAQQQSPDVVVVLMTGHASVPSVVEAMRQGAVDLVQKPYAWRDLLVVIERALAVQSLRRHNLRLQAEVRQQLEQLETVNAELDAFAARVAHDLRGPLMSIRGVLDAVLSDVRDGIAPDTGLLEMGVKSSDQSLRMVKDMLDFARLGNEALCMDPTSLDMALRGALEMLASESGGRRIQWDIASLPMVRGHAGLIRQVFVNLVGNALKYTAGRETARIAVSGEDRADGSVEVVVEDNGAGFDPDQAGDLFKPFRRLHSARQFGGEGMGLANVRRIMERHGGSVRGEGIEGQGARFTLTFPAPR